MADNKPTVKLCACGCGRPAPLATQTNNARGVKKGQPQTFINGHGRSAHVKSYRHIKVDGQIKQLHRLRAEQAIGHSLPPKAVIHHPDEDPWNRDARLVICPDNAYHRLLHARMRVKAAGGNPNTDKICPFCHQVKPLTEFHRGRFNGYCKPCRYLYMKANEAGKRKAQQEALIDRPPEQDSD